jgi:hypothetical protein
MGTYLAVYRLNTIPLEKDYDLFNDGKMRVSMKPGPIQFSYSVPIIINRPPSGGLTFKNKDICLPQDRYLTILIDFDRENPEVGVKESSLKVAEIAGIFDIQYPRIITEKLYEGTITSENNPVSSFPVGPIRITAYPPIKLEEISSKITGQINTLNQLNNANRERFQLASRWFRNGFETLNEIDKFIAWWTVLEIYPGISSSNIPECVYKLLSIRLYGNMTESEIKSKLKINEIRELRGKIIHDGKSFIEDDERDEFEDYLDRLQALTTVCLRLLAELDGGNELNKYFK